MKYFSVKEMGMRGMIHELDEGDGTFWPSKGLIICVNTDMNAPFTPDDTCIVDYFEFFDNQWTYWGSPVKPDQQIFVVMSPLNA